MLHFSKDYIPFVLQCLCNSNTQHLPKFSSFFYEVVSIMCSLLIILLFPLHFFCMWVNKMDHSSFISSSQWPSMLFLPYVSKSFSINVICHMNAFPVFPVNLWKTFTTTLSGLTSRHLHIYSFQCELTATLRLHLLSLPPSSTALHMHSGIYQSDKAAGRGKTLLDTLVTSTHRLLLVGF